ncbi:MAG TPA: capsule assembly Wzi family protein, partial [Terriglobales bacterium]|nr:capsule assembly Wzi family protein [Terriglobales bacterium]
SDVVVGSALGWYVGRQVVRAHREEESGDGAQYGQFIRDERERSPLEMASPYVPLDSWVYDAFDRLAAMGHLRTAFAGLKPWTRMECARLAAEAGDQLGPDDDGGAVQARALQHALADEFAPEVARLAGGDNFGAQVDSVYVRFTGISGTPLRDSYHFGQTIVNDYGRPYGEGFNSVTGFSSHAVAGPLAIYLSGEYQYSPGPKPYSDAVKNAIGAFHADDTFSPLGISQPGGPANRFETLDAYAVLNVRGYQLSFGKQSGWWSPDHSGSFLLSTNAEPMYMLRLNRTTPARLPWIFSALGPMRTEFFLARQSGVHRGNSETGVIISPDASFDPQPFIHGQKISFKPTPNFEFSISRTTLMGGPKFPFTTRRFINSLFSTANSFGPDDPGDRRSAVDFTWRVPKLRKWLVFYNDAFAEDEISPIAYPRRSAMNPGIYMPQIPKLPKLDFRAEGVFTDLPAGLLAPGFSYKSARYPDGYTNAGQLLGHWVGRQGSGMQFWSTYWLAPRNKVQIGYRQQWVDKDFLQGGSLQDFSARGEFMLRPDLGLTTNVQYENWKFPLLAPGKQSNFSTSVQFTWFPKWGKK